jgi:hypothetical protein
MAIILPFSTERRRRARAMRRGEIRGEVVIFSGVRIDRTAGERAAPKAPVPTHQPKPGRSL